MTPEAPRDTSVDEALAKALDGYEAKPMTPEAFKTWMDNMGFDRKMAAKRLDISYKSVCRCINGETKILRSVQYSCQLIGMVRMMVAKKSTPQ